MLDNLKTKHYNTLITRIYKVQNTGTEWNGPARSCEESLDICEKTCPIHITSHVKGATIRSLPSRTKAPHGHSCVWSSQQECCDLGGGDLRQKSLADLRSNKHSRKRVTSESMNQANTYFAYFESLGFAWIAAHSQIQNLSKSPLFKVPEIWNPLWTSFSWKSVAFVMLGSCFPTYHVVGMRLKFHLLLASERVEKKGRRVEWDGNGGVSWMRMRRKHWKFLSPGLIWHKSWLTWVAFMYGSLWFCDIEFDILWHYCSWSCLEVSRVRTSYMHKHMSKKCAFLTSPSDCSWSTCLYSSVSVSVKYHVIHCNVIYLLKIQVRRVHPLPPQRLKIQLGLMVSTPDSRSQSFQSIGKAKPYEESSALPTIRSDEPRIFFASKLLGHRSGRSGATRQSLHKHSTSLAPDFMIFND